MIAYDIISITIKKDFGVPTDYTYFFGLLGQFDSVEL